MDLIRVVCAAIVRGDRVLTARRGPAMTQTGLWELPGGKVEPGEADSAALIREIAEELALDIHVGDCLGESVYDYPTVRVRLVAYACTAGQGEPRLVEHDRACWVAAAELDGLAWAPADLPLIAAVRGILQG